MDGFTRGGNGDRAGAGFSVVELVVVIAVLGIGAALAVPRYSAAVVRYRLDAAARRVVADLDRARQAARVSSSPRTVQFKPEEALYAIAGEAALDRASGSYGVNLGEEPYRIHAMSASFDGLSTITFTAHGMVNRGGEISLRIGDQEKRIVVSAETGKADIQ